MHLLHVLAPVLLTGATGLIGGELLRALLQAGLKNLTTIARASGGLDAEARVVERLRRSGDELSPGAGLRVVSGDVRAVGLGIADRAAKRLRDEVEIIIHAASATSFIRSRECFQTNVEGMRHLIEFARGCARCPLVVYISTAANGGAVTHRCLREDEGCQPDSPHHNDYTRSKAVAEQMLWDSGLPALVLRPSIVFSAGLPDPLFARAILWFVPLLNEFDGVPVDPASRLDAVPVASVVDWTVGLLQHPKRTHNCYHLSAGPRGAITCGGIGAFLDEFYDRRVPIQSIPPGQWTREMHRRFVRTAEQRKIFSMLKHYLPFLNMDVVYDNTRLATDLGQAATQTPPFTSYMGDLLTLIPQEAAMAEAINP